MLKILLHGDDSVRSRERLNEIRSSVGESISSGPLFGGEAFEVVEGIAELAVKPLTADTIVIWEGKKLSPAQIAAVQKTVPGLQAQEFVLDPVVFKLVEAIRPGNQKEVLPLWNRYLRKNDPEVAFSMIIRQVRLLLNPKDLPSWQKDKLSRQKQFFGEERLIKIFAELLEIDYQIKSGVSPNSLTARLELWLLSL